MVTRDQVRAYIDEIIKATGLKQYEVSEQAGYGKKTLGQLISKGAGLEGVLDQLKRVFADRMKNSPLPNPERFTADQLFAMFLEVTKAQTTILNSIESKMAQQGDQLVIKEKVQAVESRTHKIESSLGKMEDNSSVAANLNFVVATVKKLSQIQDQAIENLRDDISRIQPAQNTSSKDVHKNIDQIDGDGHKPGKHRAKRK